jgi:hypothetical protein
MYLVKLYVLELWTELEVVVMIQHGSSVAVSCYPTIDIDINKIITLQ